MCDLFPIHVQPGGASIVNRRDKRCFVEREHGAGVKSWANPIDARGRCSQAEGQGVSDLPQGEVPVGWTLGIGDNAGWPALVQVVRPHPDYERELAPDHQLVEEATLLLWG